MSGSDLDDAVTLSEGPLTGDDPAPKIIAGRYHLRELLGRGGMGLVYRSFDMDLEEIVALKLLRPELAADEALRARFRCEVKLARRVTNNHVARVFEFGRDGPAYFLTMEFVPGESLQSLLTRQGALAPEHALALALELCEGLAAAHDAGVVHGDIKPGNVLVTPLRGAVLTDFGIAQAMADLGPDTSAGTPLYMAPEQARGERLGPQADVYALGVLLVVALTGASPWPERDAQRLLRRKCSGHQPDLGATMPALAPGWRQVLDDCLRATPEQRPKDGRSVAARLEALRKAAEPRARSVRSSSPVAAADGPLWISVQPLCAPTAFAWVGVDLVDALAQDRGMRVLSHNGAPPAGVSAARVEGEVQAVEAGLAVRLRVRGVTPEWTTIEHVEPPQHWHRLGHALACKIARVFARSVAPVSDDALLDVEASELYARGRQACVMLRFDEGARLLAAAHARTPDNALIHIGLVLARTQQTLLDPTRDPTEVAAISAEVEALVASPDAPGEAHFARARLAYALGDLVKCAQSLRSATSRSPSLAEAQVMLAELLLDLGRIPDAERRIEIALALNPGLSYAWHLRARAWAYEGRWAEVHGLMDGVFTSSIFEHQIYPLYIRLLLWRPDRPLLERVEAWYVRHEGRLTPRLRTHGRDLLDFGLGRGEPREIIARIAERRPLSHHRRSNCLVGQINCELYAAVGDHERAMAQLVEISEHHDLADRLWIERCPRLTALRDDPRFPRCQTKVRARADAIADAIWDQQERHDHAAQIGSRGRSRGQ